MKQYFVAPVDFECLENPVTLGDAKTTKEQPYDGEILGSVNGPEASGDIQNAGTGAGTATQVQVRNVETTRDYFSTMPEYRVDDKDGNNRAVLHNGVLVNRPTFKAGQHLALDVNGLPGGSDSAQLALRLVCGFWREVD